MSAGSPRITPTTPRTNRSPASITINPALTRRRCTVSRGDCDCAAWRVASPIAISITVWRRAAASEHGAERAEGDAQRAERFFVEGRSAMRAGRYEEACANFAESHRLDPASGALLNLAVCREAQGRTATAWTHYKAGLLLSQREANLEGQRFARERLQALEPTLCRLTIEPPVTGRFELTITLDGARIEPATWEPPARRSRHTWSSFRRQDGSRG